MFVPYEILDEIAKRADLILYDIKVMDEKRHRVFTEKSNRLVLENLKRLNENGYNIIIRMPVLKGLNDDPDNIRHMVDFLLPLDGSWHINLLPTTVHVYFGNVIGATADGRKAAEPLSEGVSPVQGADRLGPTAVVKSVGKMDHVRTGGTLLNQKFTPHLLADEEGIDKLSHLVRSYFKMDGHHVQFNVVSADTPN